MAALFNLSVKTVEKHRQQLMERLRIHDIAGLTRYASSHLGSANSAETDTKTDTTRPEEVVHE